MFYDQLVRIPTCENRLQYVKVVFHSSSSELIGIIPKESKNVVSSDK